MSRAFVKEDDSGEPPIIPKRAALPPGVDNYVTPRGLEMLKEERKELEKERGKLSGSDDAESRRELQKVNGMLEQLNSRIGTARVIDPQDQTKNEVRFGATITLQDTEDPDDKRTFTIVGVDEADIKENKIAFVAPMAKVFNGKAVNDTISFERGGKKSNLKITSISYD